MVSLYFWTKRGRMGGSDDLFPSRERASRRHMDRLGVICHCLGEGEPEIRLGHGRFQSGKARQSIVVPIYLRRPV
jgi:hypothetical protein